MDKAMADDDGCSAVAMMEAARAWAASHSISIYILRLCRPSSNSFTLPRAYSQAEIEVQITSAEHFQLRKSSSHVYQALQPCIPFTKRMGPS